MRRNLMLLCTALAVANLLVQSTPAAVIQVPLHWDRVSSAVQAANPGDVVEITNSATYTEVVVINKPITLVATPGMTPTIRGDGSNAGVIITEPGAEGAQIGSNDGGRITLAGNSSLTRTGDYVLLLNRHSSTTGPQVLSENLFLTDPVPTANSYGLYPRANGNNFYRNIDIDFGGAVGSGIRVHVNAGATTMVAVRIQNVNHALFLSGTAPGKISGLGCMFSGIVRGIETSYNTVGGTEFEFERCLFATTDVATYAVYHHRMFNMTLNFRNCVFITPNSTNSSVILRDSGGVQATFDHCDIISGNTIGLRGLANGGVDRNVRVTNTNVVAATTGMLFTAASASDVMFADYCNVKATTEYNGVTLGTHNVTPGIDPGYVNLASYNAVYTAAALMSASETGGPIGSFHDFAELEDFVPVELSSFGLN